MVQDTAPFFAGADKRSPWSIKSKENPDLTRPTARAGIEILTQRAMADWKLQTKSAL
jgi:hypothetical protein